MRKDINMYGNSLQLPIRNLTIFTSISPVQVSHFYVPRAITINELKNNAYVRFFSYIESV